MNLQTLLEKLANTTRYPAPEWMDELSAAATALLSETPRGDTAKRGSVCPCTVEGIEPCSYACTCANPVMSGGCSRCATYGSPEQQRAAAEYLVAALRSNGGTAKVLEAIREHAEFDDGDGNNDASVLRGRLATIRDLLPPSPDGKEER